MDKFVIKTSKTKPVNVESEFAKEMSASKRACVEFNPENIISDPGCRKQIEEYNVNIRDQVRRAYLAKGPYQPLNYEFPKTQFGKERRTFQKNWFKEFDWLEYSVKNDSAYCLWCYLFKPNRPENCGKDVFIVTGFRNWKKALEVFRDHSGSFGSSHSEATRRCQALKNQKQSVSHMLSAHGLEIEIEYRSRLTAILGVIRLLLQLGLPFRGHDESSDSIYKGNFLEVLEWYCQRDDQVAKSVGRNAPGNCQLTSPKVQKELVSACAIETRSVIFADIGDKYFSLMVDESRDISLKEQMAVVLRYVDKHGQVIERFISIEHVMDTSSQSLKNAIDVLFSRYGLSLSRLRGQGYDGASNMSGKFNGFKSLILKDNPSAYYVHCFAHQLQLVVVAVAKGSPAVGDFFDHMSRIVNLVGASCKRKDMLRQRQHELILERLESGETSSGKGKNQETSLSRPGDTRWGSHHKTIVRLILMWPSVVEVLGDILEDSKDRDLKSFAYGLLKKIQTFEFVFMLHLMKAILGVTNDLSEALQQKTQNIVNAMTMVRNMKQQLQSLREEKWDFFRKCQKVCVDNGIQIDNMEETLSICGRSRHEGQTITYLHKYRVEIFCGVIDLISPEMSNRFTEGNTDLLLCIASLDPRNSFSSFDHEKLLQLAQFYPEDFSDMDRVLLTKQLDNFIYDVRNDNGFSEIQNIGELAIKMVRTHRNTAYPLVYRLIELALVLPVATATVERVFSAMKILKTYLRNRMGMSG